MPDLRLNEKVFDENAIMDEKERERMAEQFALVTQEMIDKLPEEIRKDIKTAQEEIIKLEEKLELY